MHVHHLALALPQCLSVGCLQSELGMEDLLLFESVSWGRMKMAAHESVLERSAPIRPRLRVVGGVRRLDLHNLADVYSYL